jgi:ATP-dependent protease ClpP protease subunit
MRNDQYKQNGQTNSQDASSNMTREENLDEKRKQKDIEEKEDEKLEEYGQLTLDDNPEKPKIHLLTIIGEVEGHENLSGNSKATKYNHILPKLAEIEDNDKIEGMLVLLNTSGGDVDAGLAIAEMIASLSIPTVSLILGGSHSIGVPLAVCTDYSFIVPTGTMMIHPVRMSGMVIGATQTYEYFEMIQDRILSFVSNHAKIAYDQLKHLMLNTEMLTRDLGTVLVGEETVKEGLIDEVGGIKEALKKLYELMETASS